MISWHLYGYPSLYGYPRPDGQYGIRNFVGVISTVACANEIALRIVRRVPGTVGFYHQQGCGQTVKDLAEVRRVLVNLGKHPNLSSVLVVGLGCEGVTADEVAAEIALSGKPVQRILLQEEKGLKSAIAAGVRLTKDLVAQARKLKRRPFPVQQLVVGLKCGSSDATSGLISNPVVGLLSDHLVSAGATVIFSETTELLGAEEILASRSTDKTVSKALLETVQAMEERIIRTGFDIRGGQPSQGNLKGGITTIEEKSLGAVAKAGSTPVQEVTRYGQRPQHQGLVMMDGPGREPEAVTGLAAAGSHLIIFTTGRGAPQGFPFVPVLKVSANPITALDLKEHIDLDLSPVLSGEMSLSEAKNVLLDKVGKVINGQKVAAEKNRYYTFNEIYVTGPVL